MISQSKGQLFLNVALFQLGWFACVLGAAHGYPWAGTLIVTAVVAWHLWSVPHPAVEGSLMAQVVLIGTVWDSLLVWLGWISYPTGTLLAGAAPYWIVALWALFATALNVSMRWLKGRLWLAAALGAMCGPLSYWAAARLGAVVFTQPGHALVALAVGWSVLMPALMLLSQHYDGTVVAKELAS
ncbi:MAG: DUF2878 domain-containing protein [Betaproteobacteria bacterium]|nr:DUF2878 domain-containing protein [Betaproteobacteria bacterium]